MIKNLPEIDVDDEVVDKMPQPQKTDKMSEIDNLIEMFEKSGLKDTPSKVQLQEWKDLHGVFYMSSVDGDNVYLWRTLKRKEWKDVFSTGVAEKGQGMLEEFVVRRCLLWPKVDVEFASRSDAGVISTLYKQMSYKSGFISDEEALSMIEKI